MLQGISEVSTGLAAAIAFPLSSAAIELSIAQRSVRAPAHAMTSAKHQGSFDMAGIRIEGSCDPRFERVKAAFAENFEKRNEYGAAVAVTLAGQPVVDLWAGHTDKARTQAWARDTIANVFSTTKGMTAICAHRLVDQGKLDLDAPVVRYWPEFGQAGKEKMPVRMLLNHQAGLAAIRKKLNDEDMYNWETMTSALSVRDRSAPQRAPITNSAANHARPISGSST